MGQENEERMGQDKERQVWRETFGERNEGTKG